MAIDPNKSLEELLEKATPEDMKILSDAITPFIAGGSPPQTIVLTEQYTTRLDGAEGKEIQQTRINVKLIEVLNKYGLADITITEQPSSRVGSFKINGLNNNLGSLDVTIPNTIGPDSKVTVITPSASTGGYNANGIDILKGVAISRISSQEQKDYDETIEEGVKNGTILLRVVEIDGEKVIIPLQYDPESTLEKRENADKEADKNNQAVWVSDEYTVIPPPCYLDPNCSGKNVNPEAMKVANSLYPNLTDSQVKNAPSANKEGMAVAVIDQLHGNHQAREAEKGNSALSWVQGVFSAKLTKKGRASNAMLAKISGLIKEYTSDGSKIHDLAGGTKSLTGVVRQAGNYGDAVLGTADLIEGLADDNPEQVVKGQKQISSGLLKEGVIYYGTGKIGSLLANILTPPPPVGISGLLGRSISAEDWEKIKQQYPEAKGLEGKGVRYNKKRTRVTLNSNAKRALMKMHNDAIKMRTGKVGKVKGWIEFLIYLVIYTPDILGYDAKTAKKVEEENRLKNEAASKNCMMGPYVQTGGLLCIPLRGPVQILNPDGTPKEILTNLPETLVGPAYDPDNDQGIPSLATTQAPPIDVLASRGGEGGIEPGWLEKILYGISTGVQSGLDYLGNAGMHVLEQVGGTFRGWWESINGYDEAAGITSRANARRANARAAFLRGEINANQLEKALIETLEIEQQERRAAGGGYIKAGSGLLQNSSTDPTVNTNANLALETSVAQDDYDRLAELVNGLVDLGDQLNDDKSSVPDIALSNINSNTTFVTNLSEFDGDNTQFSPPASIINNGSCFTEDTFIYSIGSKIKISELKVGDPVISFDKNGNLHVDIISNVFNYTDRNISEYLFENGHCLESTETHPILTENNIFVPIGDLKIGDKVIDSNNKQITLLEINHNVKVSNVFNIEVSNNHTYIANGIRVHNKLGKEYDNQQKDDIRAELNRLRVEETRRQEDFQNWICEVMPWICDPTQDTGRPPKTDDLFNNVDFTRYSETEREAIITKVGPARRVPVGNSQFIPEGTIDNYMNSSVGGFGNQVPPEIQNPTNGQQLMGNTQKRR